MGKIYINLIINTSQLHIEKNIYQDNSSLVIKNYTKNWSI